MPAYIASVLLVIAPGELREGLRALLTTLPQVGDIEAVDDGAGALSMLERSCPELIVVDGNIPASNVQRLLERTRLECPDCRCLVLVDDPGQSEEAELTGAQAVLKGYPASQLVQVIASLVQEGNPKQNNARA